MPSPTLETSYRRRRLVLAVLCLSVLLVVMANMALNVALPTLGLRLHAGAAALAWVVDTYVLCFAGLLLPAGAIGDRFGRKGALQAGLVVFLAAAVAGALSGHVWELIAARAVMGIGAAFVMPGTLSILATVFPPAERAGAIAVWASVAGGSVALSITGAGALLDHFWWGSVFLVMAGVAAAALVLGWFLLPTSRNPDAARLDPVGAALSVVGVTGVLYGFIQAPDAGWTAAPILGAFGLGTAGLAGFVVWERRHPHPMLDLGFFGERRFAFGCLAIAAAYFALFGMYFVLTQYLQLVRGYRPLVAGLAALPAGLAQLAVAQSARPLVARYGLRRVLVLGLAASSGGLLVLADSGSGIWAVEVGLALLGAGIGLTMPPATGAIMAALPPRKAGVGSAVNDLVRELGGAFGIGVLGSVTLARYRARLDGSSTHNPLMRLPARAGSGLAQALSGAGGGHSAAGALARAAYTSGFAVAMVVGAGVVALVAVAVRLALPGDAAPGRPASPEPHRDLRDPLPEPLVRGVEVVPDVPGLR